MKRKPRKKRKPPHEKENVTQQLKKMRYQNRRINKRRKNPKNHILTQIDKRGRASGKYCKEKEIN